MCPTGPLTIKSDAARVWDAINDPTKKVAVQIAPTVKLGVIEAFGQPATAQVMGKTVTALRLMGADYVFDTSLTADLTIMEEAAEFLEKLKTGAKLRRGEAIDCAGRAGLRAHSGPLLKKS